MLLYLSIIIILIVLSVFEQEYIDFKPKYFLFWIVFLLFVFQDGLRWQTGTDWITYNGFFCNNISFTQKTKIFEIGYVLIDFLVHLVSNNYSVFLLLLSIITYLIYFKSILKYTSFPILTLLSFYCVFIGYMGMNRQHLALGICLLSFKYIGRRNFKSFFLYVFIASLFHVTSILFLVTYFLNRTFSKKTCLTLIFFAIGIHFCAPYIVNTLVVPFLPQSIVFKASIYLHNNSTFSLTGFIFGFGKRLLIFVMIYYSLSDSLRKKVTDIEIMLNIYFVSILIYIAFNNTIQVLVSRGNLFFGSLFEIFLIPALIETATRKSKFLMYFLVLCLLMLTFSKSLSTFYEQLVPYKGVFINTDFSRKKF